MVRPKIQPPKADPLTIVEYLVDTLRITGSVNRSAWEQLTPTAFESFVDRVTDFYFEKGYPQYVLEESSRVRVLQRMREYDYDDLITRDGTILQRMIGMDLLWFYFPQAVQVKCGKHRTPMENFSDKDIFRRVVRKRLLHGDNISTAAIRKALRLYENAHAVSGFRPSAATAIYRRYLPVQEGNRGRFYICDPCAGWGGRLLGSAMVAAQNEDISVHYVGNEVEPATRFGLRMLGGELREFLDGAFLYSIDPRRSEESVNLGWEGKMDLTFTSPPYFNTERYNDENPNQSYVRYPTYDEWISGFLTPMLERCIFATKPGGKVIMNVANTKSAPNLEDDIQTIMTHTFRRPLVETLKYSLSQNPRPKGGDYPSHKYEPVFVWSN